MKIISSCILFFFSFIGSCQSQKLMNTIKDAEKLTINKNIFINKPLKKLLNEISPPIKAALGNPEDVSPTTLPSISFYFANKNEFNKRRQNGENPTRILVRLKRPDNKLYPKLDPNSVWTIEQTKVYGDMIVVDFSIIGKN